MLSLSYLTPLLLNFFQSFNQPYLDHTCLTCPILPPEGHLTKGSIYFEEYLNSHRIYKCPNTRSTHLNSHRIYRCPHTRSTHTHTQEFTNNSYTKYTYKRTWKILWYFLSLKETLRITPLNPRLTKTKFSHFFCTKSVQLSSPKWELYIENISIGSCTNLALKNNQTLNGKLSRS